MRIHTLTVGLLLAAAFAFAKPVLADERPPRFDLDGFCNSRALTPEGFSPETMAACVAAQSEALDALRRLWPVTRAFIQDHCSYEAKAVADGDYQVLETCIRAQNRQQLFDEGALTRPKEKAKPGTTAK